jgi:hypothetical protein
MIISRTAYQYHKGKRVIISVAVCRVGIILEAADLGAGTNKK